MTPSIQSETSQTLSNIKDKQILQLVHTMLYEQLYIIGLVICILYLLWPPCVADADIIF